MSATLLRFWRMDRKWKLLFGSQASFTLYLIKVRFRQVSDKKAADLIQLARAAGTKNPEKVRFGVYPENRTDLIVDHMGQLVKGNPSKKAIWDPLLDRVGEFVTKFTS